MLQQNWQTVEEWMELYADRILRMVCLVVNDPHLAEEITQEVFIKAYEHAPDFRRQASPYTWLYRIALNLSRNCLKRRRHLQFEPWKGDIPPNELSHFPPEAAEDQVVRRETGRAVRSCISRLPLRYREVIVLYYYADLKISDIARILEQPEGTVKSHLSRGRETLEKLLRKEGLAYGREGRF